MQKTHKIEASIDKLHFCNCFFWYHDVFLTQKNLKGQRYKKIGALRKGFTYAPVCPAGGNSSTWFRPALVEQVTKFIITSMRFPCLGRSSNHQERR